MMNKFGIYALKGLKKAYSKGFPVKTRSRQECDQNPDSSAETIYQALMGENPCMIARFGSTEMACLRNALGVNSRERSIINYIKGEALPWWWEMGTINQMQEWSGFFPAQIDKIEEFCDLMFRDIPEVDILGSWLPDERLFERDLRQAKKIRFIFLDPFWSSKPWTRALQGKRVLVVHPFAETIERQYKKRELLFNNRLLPDFNLKTIKAVQSIAGTQTPFVDWFEALEYMKNEIDKTEYDICLIGCGAYGFPLAAHVKRRGKKGFQMGGSLQLLFGIKGRRWDRNYSKDYDYSILPNEYWISPDEKDRPEGAIRVEGACYW